MGKNCKTEKGLFEKFAFTPQTSIEELLESGAISVHLYNCFKTAGFTDIHSIYDFRVKNGMFSFLNLKNFGQKALNEIENLLEGSFTPQPPATPACSERFSKVCKPIFDRHSNGLLRAVFPTAADFCQSVNTTTTMPYYEGTSLTIEQMTEMWQTTAKIINDVLDKPESKKFSKEQRNHLIYVSRLLTLQQERMKFQIGYSKKKDNPVVRKLMTDHYMHLCDQLSTRTRTLVMHYMPEYTDAIERYVAGGLSTDALISRGRKSVSEINELQKAIFKFAQHLASTDVEEIEQAAIKTDFAFLGGNERDFVLQYYAAHKHLPMLFILYRHIMTSSARYETFFRQIYGLGCRKMSRKEIAEESGLSFERVRQLLKTNGLPKAITDNADWHFYKKLMSAQCVKAGEPSFEAIRAEERLSEIPFDAFGHLCCLAGDYVVIGEGDKSALVKSTLYEASQMKHALKKIEITALARSIQQKTIAPTEFLDSHVLRNLDAGTCRQAIDAIRDIAQAVYNVGKDQAGNLVFRNTAVDIENELYDILDKNGEPLHVTEIFNRFKEQHPDHRYVAPQQIRPYLLTSQRIHAIGKSSKFAIDKWKDVYTGTIRQLIYATIDSSLMPIETREVFEKVREVFPDTNLNSVCSMIYSDKRFCRYKRSRVGIDGRSYEGFEPDDKTTWQRFTFAQRLQQFKEFIKRHNRVPMASNDAHELTLMRWKNNIKSGRVKISDSERKTFDTLIEEHSYLMMSKIEYTFMQRCEALKQFVSANKRLPRLSENPQLYNWYRKIRLGELATDRRKEFTKDLQSFLEANSLSLNK